MAELIALTGVGVYVFGCVLAVIGTTKAPLSLFRGDIPMYIGLLVAGIGIMAFGTREADFLSGGTLSLGLGPSYGFFLAVVLAPFVTLGRRFGKPEATLRVTAPASAPARPR